MKVGGTGYKRNRKYSPVLGEFTSHEKGLGRLRKQFANRHINIVQTVLSTEQRKDNENNN